MRIMPGELSSKLMPLLRLKQLRRWSSIFTSIPFVCYNENADSACRGPELEVCGYGCLWVLWHLCSVNNRQYLKLFHGTLESCSDWLSIGTTFLRVIPICTVGRVWARSFSTQTVRISCWISGCLSSIRMWGIIVGSSATTNGSSWFGRSCPWRVMGTTMKCKLCWHFLSLIRNKILNLFHSVSSSSLALSGCRKVIVFCKKQTAHEFVYFSSAT